MSYEIIKRIKIVPVVKIENAADAVAVVGALEAGGIPVAEITFRTSAAEEAIKAAAERFPDSLIGAGTVVNDIQAARAVAAGAKFIVSPGFSDRVDAFCREAKILYIPGAVTPTEIMRATAGGNRIIKFFPATVFGGVKALKALGAPFGGIEFIPTGGIDNANLAEFLSLKNVLAAGGSWMVRDSLIAEGKFDEIAEISKKARAIAEEF